MYIYVVTGLTKRILQLLTIHTIRMYICILSYDSIPSTAGIPP